MDRQRVQRRWNLEFTGPGGTADGYVGDYDLAGDNSGFTGTITVDGAQLRDDNGPANFGAAAITVLPGGQVLAETYGATYNNAITLNGTGWMEYPGVSYGACDGQRDLGRQRHVGERRYHYDGGWGNSSITGVIGGDFALDLGGSGTLTLAGDTGNTYAGDTNVEQGVLLLGKTAGVAVPGDLKISALNGGAVVALQGDGQISSSSFVTFGGGTVAAASTRGAFDCGGGHFRPLWHRCDREHAR